MGPPLHMWSVSDQNIIIWHMTVHTHTHMPAYVYYINMHADVYIIDIFKGFYIQ